MWHGVTLLPLRADYNVDADTGGNFQYRMAGGHEGHARHARQVRSR